LGYTPVAVGRLRIR